MVNQIVVNGLQEIHRNATALMDITHDELFQIWIENVAKMSQAFLDEYSTHQDYLVTKTNSIKTYVLKALYVLREYRTSAEYVDQDYSVARIAAITNDLIDHDNQTPFQEWARHKPRERHRHISSKQAGMVLSDLGLRTSRSASHINRRYQVVWDDAQIGLLWEIFCIGTTEQEKALAAYTSIIEKYGL